MMSNKEHFLTEQLWRCIPCQSSSILPIACLMIKTLNKFSQLPLVAVDNYSSIARPSCTALLSLMQFETTNDNKTAFNGYCTTVMVMSGRGRLFASPPSERAKTEQPETL